MEIVDAQIHASQRGLEQTIAIMDAVGVNATVLDDWPPTRNKLEGGINRYSYPFAQEAVSRFPARFAPARLLVEHARARKRFHAGR